MVKSQDTIFLVKFKFQQIATFANGLMWPDGSPTYDYNHLNPKQ